MKYGIIHATVGSVQPLKRAILALMPEAEVVNFVNEEMLAYANRAGRVDETAMRMFARIVFAAEEVNVDAIMIACNIFAPRIDAVKPFISVPILAVDAAMQELAAKIGGKIGIIGTNKNSFPSCSSGISSAYKRLAENEPQPYTEPLTFVDGSCCEAAAILEKGDTETFDRLLTESALLLEKEGCSAIVLAQLTTARAKASILKAGVRIPVLSSPDEAARALCNLRK